MTRLLQRAAALLDSWADRKLEPAITSSLAPPPATGSLSPHRISLTDRPGRPAPQTYEHCTCCWKYSIAGPCTFTHTTPCDRTECGQTWAATS